MLYKLRIISKFDPKRIDAIDRTTIGDRPEGLLDLFLDLQVRGRCESCSASRIYYMAYLLAENYPSLKFEVIEE